MSKLSDHRHGAELIPDYYGPTWAIGDYTPSKQVSKYIKWYLVYGSYLLWSCLGDAVLSTASYSI
jgi:hypothetical protein